MGVTKQTDKQNKVMEFQIKYMSFLEVKSLFSSLPKKHRFLIILNRLIEQGQFFTIKPGEVTCLFSSIDKEIQVKCPIVFNFVICVSPKY